MENSKTTAAISEPYFKQKEDIMNNILMSLQNEEFSPGDKAKLRRAAQEFLNMDSKLDAKIGGCLPLFKIAAEFNISDLMEMNPNSANELSLAEKWSLWLLCALQLFSPHQNTVSVGKALSESKISQIRLLKLLNAENKSLIKEVLSILHLLKSKGIHVDIIKLGHLIFSKGKASKIERLTISRDYYYHENKN